MNVAKILFLQGARIDAKDNDEKTPLFGIATKQGNI